MARIALKGGVRIQKPAGFHIAEDDAQGGCGKKLAQQGIAPLLAGAGLFFLGDVADDKDIAAFALAGTARGDAGLEPAVAAVERKLILLRRGLQFDLGARDQGFGDLVQEGRQNVAQLPPDQRCRRADAWGFGAGMNLPDHLVGPHFQDQVGQRGHGCGQLIAAVAQGIFGLLAQDQRPDPVRDRAQQEDVSLAQGADIAHCVIADEAAHDAVILDRRQQHRADALHLQEFARIGEFVGQGVHIGEMHHLVAQEHFLPGCDHLARDALGFGDHRVDPRGAPFVGIVPAGRIAQPEQIGPVKPRHLAQIAQRPVDGPVRPGRGRARQIIERAHGDHL